MTQSQSNGEVADLAGAARKAMAALQSGRTADEAIRELTAGGLSQTDARSVV